MTRRPVLVVMAKAPRLGGGKSRLAREIGAVEAWRVNRWLHRRTLQAASDIRWRTVLAVAPHAALSVQIPGVWPAGVARVSQGRGDLGARLRRAVRCLSGPVAVIGSDCPETTSRDIAAAFRALAQAPAAIGLSPDGGFWIAAARRGSVLAQAFEGVRWSSVHAGADVRARLPAHVVLRTLQDVDTLADLRAVRGRLSARAGGGRA